MIEMFEEFNWYFNNINHCWDKVVVNEDKTYTAYQWDESSRTWSTQRELTAHQDIYPLSIKLGENDFDYWYATGELISSDSIPLYYFYSHPDANNDHSVLGELKIWRKGNWEIITGEKLSWNKKTYLISHGLLNTYNEPWLKEMARALSKEEPDAQILCVDWGDAAKHGLDVTAKKIKTAAERASILLGQHIGYNIEAFTQNLNLIGHSYGAHLCAYLSDFLKGKPATLVALDAAEESPQYNPIVLSPESAQTVTFYKSSGIWGGETSFGKYNFILIDENEHYLQSIGWQWDMGPTGHGLAYGYYTNSISASSSYNFGYKLKQVPYINDLDIFNVGDDRWIGIIDSSGKVECLSIGYENGRWKASNYLNTLNSVQTALDQGIFSSFKVWIDKKTQGEISDRMLAVAGLTDYSLYADDGITSLCPRVMDGSHVVEEMMTNRSYDFFYSVRNGADNRAFDPDYILDMQENLHSVYQIWVSASEKFSDATSHLLISEKLRLAPGQTSYFFSNEQKIKIEKDTVEKLVYGSNDTNIIKKYELTGKADLYLFGRAGFNSETKDYIAGELYKEDNVSSAKKITVSTNEIRTIFVIDDTGSMSEEIDAVRNALLHYIETMRRNTNPDEKAPYMQLITFKDDVTVRLTTNNWDEMYAAVSGLTASDGGDMPEYSNQALREAVNNIADQGTILFATDAPSHSGVNMNNVLKEIARKRIKIHTVLSGSMSSATSTSSATMISSRGRTEDDTSASYGTKRGFSAEVSNDIDTIGNTKETAMTIAVEQKVTDTVHYGENRYDWYEISLNQNHIYTIDFQSGAATAYLSFYDDDGAKLLRSIEKEGSITVSPDKSSTYYIRVRASLYDTTPYSFTVHQTAAASIIGNSLESFSILATETGGAFLSLPNVNYGNSDAYESAIYNVLMSQTKPVVLSCGPFESRRGTTTTILITGSQTNWRDGETDVKFNSGSIRTLSVKVYSATSLMATIEIDDDCILDSFDVTVTSASESAIGYDVLTVISQPSSPEIISVETAAFICGQPFSATIRGFMTSWSSETIESVNLGPGVTLTKITVESESIIRIEGKIEENAELGYRTVQVMKSDGSSDSLSHAVFVSSMAPALPSITLISPNEITTGKDVDITIKANNLNFTSGRVNIDAGGGIDILSITVLDSETLHVKLSVAEEAQYGFRDIKVSVNDQMAVLADGLDILPYNDTISKATELTLSSNNQLTHVDSLSQADKIDYFKITPSKGGSYTIGIDPDRLNSIIQLSIGLKDDFGNFTSLHSLHVTPYANLSFLDGITLLNNHDYYIRVESFEQEDKAIKTTYNLSVKGVSPLGVTQDDNVEQASNVLNEDTNAKISGWVGYGDATDFYTFSLDETATLHLGLDGLETPARVDVFRKNAAGGLTQVMAGSARPSGLDRELALSSGTYFVQVSSYDQGAGRYNTAYELDLELEKDGERRQYALASR